MYFSLKKRDTSRGIEERATNIHKQSKITPPERGHPRTKRRDLGENPSSPIQKYTSLFSFKFNAQAEY